MNAPEELAIETRRSKVLELQIAGKSYRQIAEELDVSLGTVASDMKALVERAKSENDERVERERMLSLARNGRALGKVLPLLDDDETIKDAVDALDKLEKRRAALLGLDAPTKVSAEVSTVGLDELDELRKAARANTCSSSDPQKPSDENAPSS